MAQTDLGHGPADNNRQRRPARSISQEQLQRALQEALYRGGPDDESDGKDDLIALREFARQFPDREFEFDPTVIELVKVMVKRLLHVEPDQSPRLQMMCQQIAQTLWENDPTRQRIQVLWEQVKGE